MNQEAREKWNIIDSFDSCYLEIILNDNSRISFSKKDMQETINLNDTAHQLVTNSKVLEKFNIIEYHDKENSNNPQNIKLLFLADKITPEFNGFLLFLHELGPVIN
jgi:hypothetical protein